MVVNLLLQTNHVDVVTLLVLRAVADDSTGFASQITKTVYKSASARQSYTNF
jgi:hypothetical protein